MKKEDKYNMCVLVADMSTGEILSKVSKTYDLRFRSENMFIHGLLDKFLERIRQGGYDNITFEVQYGKKAFEYPIPF